MYSMLVQDCRRCVCGSARTQELEQQQPGVEEELRRLLEKPGELLLAGLPSKSSFFFSFFFALNFVLLGSVRSPEVQSGATARGDADAAAGGDRGWQERHRGGPG